MTTKEAVALLERYSNYDGMGIPNLAGCKEAMRVAVDALKEAYPELRESEDERIRKELIEAFEVYDIESSWNLIPVKHILAWLEKQKEQKLLPGFDDLTPEEKMNHPLYLEGFDVGRESGLRDGQKYVLNNLDSYGLCKSAEWSEDDEKHLIWLCRIIHSRVVNKELSLAEESKLGEWIDKWINHKPQSVQKWDEFDEDCLKRAIWYVENPAPLVVKDTNLVLWLKSLPGRFNLQPKQEWSKEEKDKLNSIERLIVNANAHGNGLIGDKEAIELQHFIRSIVKPITNIEEWSEEDEILRVRTINRLETLNFHGISGKEIHESIDWLKSLPLNLKKKNDDVAKLCSNEWSEEDEKMLQSIIKNFRAGKVSTIGQERWLKSLRPQYHGDVTMTEAYKMGVEAGKASHWKPSEEQMEALNSLLCIGDFSYVGQATKLQELYIELKKL